MQPDDVSLLIGGHSHANWQSYSIDSNLLTPADEWQMSLGMKHSSLPDYVVEGADVRVMLGNDVVMVGRIDDIEDDVSGNELSVDLSGRDSAGVLLDCSAAIFSARQMTLEDVIAKVVIPLGIHNVQVNASASVVFEKVAAEPGETAWDILQHAAEATGLWPWMAPDGTLIVGGADYSVPVVANLFLNYSGEHNNVLSLRRRRSIVDRFSEVTILGQNHGTEINDGEHAILGRATDKAMTVYRPKVIIDSESTSRDMALMRARKLLADGRLSGYALLATVKGHRITEGGTLWTPGQRISVRSEPHKIDAIFFLMGRTFRLDVSNGPVTELVLKEDGVWTLDAHPHQIRHKKARGIDGKEFEIYDETQ